MKLQRKAMKSRVNLLELIRGENISNSFQTPLGVLYWAWACNACLPRPSVALAAGRRSRDCAQKLFVTTIFRCGNSDSVARYSILRNSKRQARDKCLLWTFMQHQHIEKPWGVWLIFCWSQSESAVLCYNPSVNQPACKINFHKTKITK